MVSNTSVATAYGGNETTSNNETEVEIELILFFWISGIFLSYCLFFEWAPHSSPVGLTCRLLRDPPRNPINFVGQYVPLAIVLSNFFLYAYMIVYLKRRMVKVKPRVWINEGKNKKSVETKRYIDEQTKIVMKLSLITGSFILMCTPYLITLSLGDAQVGEKFHHNLRLVTGTLIFMNSAWNPVLYVWRFKEARYHLKRMVCIGGPSMQGKIKHTSEHTAYQLSIHTVHHRQSILRSPG